MDKVQILALSAAFAIVAVRIYQKYIRKKDNQGSEMKSSTGKMNSPNSGIDDYEPYSKK